MINIESNRREVTRVLNNLLSDEYLLSTKTKNYHWNVTGPHFQDLHRLLGCQYAELDLLIDRLGERIRALGGNAFGTMTDFLRCTRLQERPGVRPGGLSMAEDLYDDHKILLLSLRGSLAGNASVRSDIGTAELLRSAIQGHEKMVSMLQSVFGKHDQLKKWLKAQEDLQREIGIEALAPTGSAT